MSGVNVQVPLQPHNLFIILTESISVSTIGFGFQRIHEKWQIDKYVQHESMQNETTMPTLTPGLVPAAQAQAQAHKYQ